jgi:hypothetical protein
LPTPVLTENGTRVTSLSVSAPERSASGTYVISYRSLLPPQVKAVVSAKITGLPAATTTYTTPALNITGSENLERRWRDSRYVTIVVIVAVLALLALALLGRLKHRD